MIQFTCIILLLVAFSSQDKNPTIIRDQLLSSPEVITLSHLKVVLRPSLWISYSGINTYEDIPINVGLGILTEKESNIPNDLKIDSVWIIYDKNLWSSGIVEVEYIASVRPNILRAVLNHGPIMKIGTNAIVVILLRDGDGNKYFLKAPEKTVTAAH